MKLRTRARYSVRMMMAIAKLSLDGHPVGLGSVSRHCGVTRRYLDQLVTPLRNAKLVRAFSGREGGYTLGRPAEDIKVGDIIEAAIGAIAVADCAIDSDSCIHAEYCNCRGLWTLINHKINEVLDEYSLEDILADDWSKTVEKELSAMA